MQAVFWSFTLLGCLYALFRQIPSPFPKKGQRRLKWMDHGARIEKEWDRWLRRNKRMYSLTERCNNLLQKSRIRIGGRPLNKYLFLFLVTTLFLYTAIYASGMLYNPVAGLLLGGVAAYLPVHGLKWDARYRKRQMRRQAPHFFLTLMNFYEVHHDILSAVKDAVPRLKQPLRADLQFLVLQLQNGNQTLRESIQDVKQRFDNKLLQDFLDDLELQIRYGGDFSNTLKNYAEEAIELEIRIMERSSETAGASLVTYFLFGVFLMLLVSMRRIQPQAIQLLVTHPVGKLTVVVILLIMLAVLYVLKEVTEVEEQ
ncbi:type II secretion system F family protein [Effusibacillus dendaii]|uniref:Type II secretion system protein GspF domain-containing protein n=1 Tax=Effusibacillus dendaii TaxID=2743772 RepID=A0A7I8DDR9_9BACL|nr:type II secretion system F family protein [Effusibacillus dendaii]BCJ88167.1 hypothetical protein skT53_31520 [Effusibacillus dendaii]